MPISYNKENNLLQYLLIEKLNFLLQYLLIEKLNFLQTQGTLKVPSEY